MQQNNLANYQAAMEQVRTASYIHPLSFYTAYAASVDSGGNGATKYDVFDYINGGMNIIAYNGHGNPHEMYMNYSVPNPNGIYSIFWSDTLSINRDRAPVLVSTGCRNGYIPSTWSLMRLFLKTDHGFTAMLGGSHPVYTDPANLYLKKFYEGLLNDDDYHIGHLNVSSHIKCLSYGGSTPKDNAFCFICAADPSLELWTAGQSTFQNVDYSFSQSSLTITVGNASNYAVNVASADGQLLGRFVSTNGICVIPRPDVDCYIAIDKHNYVPYVVHVDGASNYIQNTVMSGTEFYLGSPISVGYDVSSSLPTGNVTIEPDAHVTIFNSLGVTIKNGFECKKGAELIVR